MADYVIGDVQGCYTPLMQLLDTIHYDATQDNLWFVGDLVNRGPDSLQVLRFIYALEKPAIITLGNHDLSFLVRLFTSKKIVEDTSLHALLQAEDRFTLGHWLRKQPLFYADKNLQVVMTHAGIPPLWTIQETEQYAQEVSDALMADNFEDFLAELYGNQPDLWSPALQGIPRLRCIVNYLTRMRLCDKKGRLDFSYTGPVKSAPEGLYPWYAHPLRQPISQTLVFGHWAALEAVCPIENVYALDTGCVWGEALTALRLQDKQLFSVRMKE